MKYISRITLILLSLLLFPVAALSSQVDMILDDGSVDNNIGIGGTREFIWANYFTADSMSFPFQLREVQVYFSSDTTSVNIGDNIRLVIYGDDDTDPSNGAALVASIDETVKTLGDWNSYILATPIDFTEAKNIFLGVIAMETPGTSYFPAALDTTASQGKSWAGWWQASPPPDPATLPPDDTWGTIDSFGFPGNWLIRGIGMTFPVVSTTVIPSGAGNINCIPNPVPYGSDTTCTATANPDFAFDSFAGDCNGVTGDTCVLQNVTSDKTVIGNFHCAKMTIAAGIINTQELYECDQILAPADVEIEFPGDVEFRAVYDISIGPGFRVGKDAKFKSTITP